jgi:hypothetical protein
MAYQNALGRNQGVVGFDLVAVGACGLYGNPDFVGLVAPEPVTDQGKVHDGADFDKIKPGLETERSYLGRGHVNSGPKKEIHLIEAYFGVWGGGEADSPSPRKTRSISEKGAHETFNGLLHTDRGGQRRLSHGQGWGLEFRGLLSLLNFFCVFFLRKVVAGFLKRGRDGL